MKKESIIASIVLTIVVIAASVFLWSKITTSTVALTSGDENVAAVAAANTTTRTYTTGTNDSLIPGCVGSVYQCHDPKMNSIGKQITAISNSFFSPNLKPYEADGTTFVGLTASTLISFFSDVPSTALSGVSEICKKPVTLRDAQWMITNFAALGKDVSSIISTSTQYVFTMGGMNTGIHDTFYPLTGYYNGYLPEPMFNLSFYGYCLDAGYVSNYPNYVQKVSDFLFTHKDAVAVQTIIAEHNRGLSVNFAKDGTLYPFGGTPAFPLTTAASSPLCPIKVLPYSCSANSGTGTGGVITPINTASTSISSYSVSVNYDKFTAEAAQYGYTSVFSSTGTKTVSIAVIKFPNGSSLTGAQAISQLSAMGYRPATISELAGLKAAQSSVANTNMVALGTNLGGTNGYSTGQGSGTSGMGHSAGPFNTSLFKFAAVSNQ